MRTADAKGARLSHAGKSNPPPVPCTPSGATGAFHCGGKHNGPFPGRCRSSSWSTSVGAHPGGGTAEDRLATRDFQLPAAIDHFDRLGTEAVARGRLEA